MMMPKTSSMVAAAAILLHFGLQASARPFTYDDIQDDLQVREIAEAYSSDVLARALELSVRSDNLLSDDFEARDELDLDFEVREDELEFDSRSSYESLHHNHGIPPPKGPGIGTKIVNGIKSVWGKIRGK